MISFLKLIRWQNLLIIALTQYLIRWCVFHPVVSSFPIKAYGTLKFYKLGLQFDSVHFALLVLATMLIAAGGYIINDYYDVETDEVNKPEKTFIGRTIGKKTAFNLQFIFHVVGIAIGFYLSFKVDVWQLGMIFFIISGLLWYYSSMYKRQFLVGNIIISLLAALVPLLAGVFEELALVQEYREIMQDHQVNFNIIFQWSAAFAAFAFVSTFAREVIKDMEDLEGDKLVSMNTIPITLGTNWSKAITIFFQVLIISGLWAGYFLFLKETITMVYFLLISLFIIYQMYFLVKAEKKSDYHHLSIFAKVTMVLGVLYAPVLYFIAWFYK